MPVSEITALLEFSGTIKGAGIWNTGLWMTADTFPADPQTGVTTVATGAAAAFSQLWTDELGAFNTADTTFAAASCRLYAAGAKASSAYAIQPAAAVLTGTGTDSAPASQACVVTLQSPLAGRSGRGRMYMPATAATGAGADEHAFPLSKVNGLIPALVTFFIATEALTLDNSHALAPVVRSLKMGTVHPFKQFRVDTRPDRQEHRERGLVFASRASGFA